MIKAYAEYNWEKTIGKKVLSYVEVTKEDAENVANAYRIRHETDMETLRNFEAAVKMCVEGEVL